MEREKSKKRALLLLIPVALLLLLVAMIDREPPPPSAPVAPAALVQNAAPEPAPEPEVPDPAPLVASAMMHDPTPEPAPAPAPAPKKAKKEKAPEPEPAPPPPEEAVEEPVQEPAPEEAPPPPEEPAVEDPKVEQEETPKEPVNGSIEVFFEDDLAFVRPLSVRVAFDGDVVALKQLAEGQGEDPMQVHKGPLQVGTHTMDLQIKLTGDGGGLFSYVDAYVFTAKQHAVVEVKEEQNVRIFITTFERSATEVWENRVGLKVEIRP